MSTTATARTPVHITGRGAVSCFGIGRQALLRAVAAGECGIRPLDRLEGTDCLTEVAAEIPPEVRAGVERDTDLPRRLAGLAAREAVDDHGGTLAADTMLVLASTKADMSAIFGSTGDGTGSPHELARQLAAELGVRGPVAAISCACASGLAALAYAARELRAGTATRALVLGTDCITPFILRGFSSLLALSPGPCRPFDRGRRGLSLGEGAGAVMLSIDAAESRGLELASWGESNDANHITGPSRDGGGLALAITRALRHAGLTPAAVDYVHLHGTGTVYNDAMETKALARVFDPVPCASGSKGQFGHTLGAAGLLESLVALDVLERGRAPGNHGLVDCDDGAPVELPTAPAELRGARVAVKVAAGFGGINAALVFRRTDP